MFWSYNIKVEFRANISGLSVADISGSWTATVHIKRVKQTIQNHGHVQYTCSPLQDISGVQTVILFIQSKQTFQDYGPL